MPQRRNIHHLSLAIARFRDLRKEVGRVRVGRGLGRIFRTQNIDRPIARVACGYLRELERCSPTSLRAITRFVGLDHDRRTTNFLTRQAYSDFVEPLTASIGVLLRKEIDLGSFDLIYAAGIYDYLQDDLFIALTRRLWEMCRSGGTLLIANVTAANPQIGYLDACMDWRFVLRDEERISLLLDAAIGDSHSAKHQTGIVGFAKLEKA